MTFKKYQLLLLACLSGILFSLCWFPNGIFPFLFVASVLLLFIEDYFFINLSLCLLSLFFIEYYFFSNISLKPRSLFLYTYIAFFLWNILTTWWVKNASFGGAAMAIFCNALLMSIPFLLFHRTRKRVGIKWSYVLF